MRNTHLFILSLLFATGVGTVSGSEPFENRFESKDSISILFHQGKSNIDLNFKNNRRAFTHLDSILKEDRSALKDIHIIGAASPEGGVALNYNLSDRRAEIILSQLREMSDFDPAQVEVSFIGRDWKRLLELAQTDHDIPYKDETIGLLRDIVNQISVEKKETEKDHNLNRLKNLANGIPYSYLYRNIFPQLRESRLYFNYRVLPVFNGVPYLPYLNATTPDISLDYINYTIIPEKKEGKNFYMALKTNMLYDAILLPSIGAEFYLGKNFSAVANWTYGWWDKNSSHRYWRAYGGDIAVRWWFGKAAELKPLTGHHLGIYGGINTFDFELGGKGYMGGIPGKTLWDRSLRTFGVEYGYSLPIAKRLNIDFTLGIGYLGGKYIKYIPSGEKYLWQSTHKLNWFGPTKAEVSLTWLIGNGNYNAPKRKGGNL